MTELKLKLLVSGVPRKGIVATTVQSGALTVCSKWICIQREISPGTGEALPCPFSGTRVSEFTLLWRAAWRELIEQDPGTWLSCPHLSQSDVCLLKGFCDCFHPPALPLGCLCGSKGAGR